MSVWQRPEASMCTSTCPSPGTGFGTSSRNSGCSKEWTTAARIVPTAPRVPGSTTVAVAMSTPPESTPPASSSARAGASGKARTNLRTYPRPMETRWRALVDAGIAVTSELSLDAVLQRIVEAAAELTGAMYAALGVIDPAGRGLERFLTTGIDPETHARIGDLPHGRGILGVLIDDAEPLRLHALGADPRAVGFPPHHPLMQTFLGVPIVLRGVAYGNLYLTEKEGGKDFTVEDEELVTLLAAQAAVAIENARLYESATRWLTQLESLTEVGNALAGETELQPLLELIAVRLAGLIDAELVVIALPTATASLRIHAAAGPRA